MTHRHVFGFLMLATVAGCPKEFVPPPADLTAVDMAMVAPDLSGPDLSSPPDLSEQPDLTEEPDLATPTPLKVVLSGSQEVPPHVSAGSGTGSILISADRTTIGVTVDFAGFSNTTAAHIHVNIPGANGPIIFPLGGVGVTSPIIKTLTAADLTVQAGSGINTFADAVAAILAGKTYINIHTTTNPGGELRGHIGTAVIKAQLSGAQETPPLALAGTGTVDFTINGLQDQIDLTVTYSGTTADATNMHIHASPIGRAGPIILPIGGGASPKMATLTAADLMPQAGQGVTTFTEAVDAILSGRTYVNVHTAANPGGELRGQIGAVTVRGILSSGQEVPTNASVARGTGVVTVDAEQASMTVSLNVPNIVASNAHIHVNTVGVNGPVIFPFTQQLPLPISNHVLKSADLMPQAGSNINTFADAASAILTGRTYFNVHTVAFPGGEVRGQIGPVLLRATLDGTSEFPPVVTLATGSATVLLDGTQSQAELKLTTTGLGTITNAHVHAAAPMMNGNIIFPLGAGPFTNMAIQLNMGNLMPDGTVGINTMDDAANALLSKVTYVNVHTTANPSGEIRGQVVP